MGNKIMRIDNNREDVNYLHITGMQRLRGTDLFNKILLLEDRDENSFNVNGLKRILGRFPKSNPSKISRIKTPMIKLIGENKQIDSPYINRDKTTLIMDEYNKYIVIDNA